MSYQIPIQREPIMCPYCGVEARYVDSAVIYGGNSFGMIYLCSNYPKCDARICAAGEGRPIGTLARQELRELRRACHHCFDVLWKGEGAPMTRDEAYAYLRKLMQLLHPGDAHFGRFDEARCRKFLERWHCQGCRKNAERGWIGPSHEGSLVCRNRTSIAAGGTKAHCTCRGCF